MAIYAQTKTRRFQADRTSYVSPCRNLVEIRGPGPSQQPCSGGPTSSKPLTKLRSPEGGASEVRGRYAKNVTICPTYARAPWKISKNYPLPKKYMSSTTPKPPPPHAGANKRRERTYEQRPGSAQAAPSRNPGDLHLAANYRQTYRKPDGSHRR